MWNFTVRGAIIPDISAITDLMNVKETATMPQSDMSSIKAEDLFLGTVYDYTDTYLLYSICAQDVETHSYIRHISPVPEYFSFSMRRICFNTKEVFIFVIYRGPKEVKCVLEIAHLLLGKWDLMR